MACRASQRSRIAVGAALAAIELPLDATWTTNQRAIQWIQPAQAPQTWDVGISLERRATDGPLKSGEDGGVAQRQALPN